MHTPTPRTYRAKETTTNTGRRTWMVLDPTNAEIKSAPTLRSEPRALRWKSVFAAEQAANRMNADAALAKAGAL